MPTPQKKPTPRSGEDPALTAQMLEDLARSGLDAEDAALMRLRPYARGVLPGVAPPAAGYLIPYFTQTGQPRVDMWRYRYLEDTRNGFRKLSTEKPRRYTQPADTAPEVYWAPFTAWREILTTASIPLIITEGEKKAALATKLGLPCVGLGGVWSFRSKRLGVHLLPELAEVAWESRTVIVAYDSDAALNDNVCKAELALCDVLTAAGALVKLVRLPELVAGQKCALDDYLVSEGVERFVELAEGTETYAQGRELHKLNAEVVYVKNPGVVYVRADGQLVRPGDFTAHRFANRKYTRQVFDNKGMPKIESRRTAPDWLQWECRAEASKFVFDPAAEYITAERALNLWRGWPYEPLKGDVTPWVELLNFLFRNDTKARRYFEQWAAYPIQYPGTKLRNAVALWGVRKGTGKSTIGYTLGDLYGEAYYEINDEHLSGASPHNEWARHRHFVMGDEVTGDDSRRVANRIKGMVTRERVEINSKNVPQYTIADCINYIFTANGPDCFYMEEGDRRIFVHEVRGAPLTDAFYAEYNTWRYSTAGRRALMHHLRYEVDTSDFNPAAKPPDTLDKLEMIANTRTELEAWLATARDHPELFCQKFGNSDIITVSELILLHEAEGYKRPSPSLLARKLKELGLDPIYPTDSPLNSQFYAGGKLVRVYALRNENKWRKLTTAELREAYEKSRGMGRSKKF